MKASFKSHEERIAEIRAAPETNPRSNPVPGTRQRLEGDVVAEIDKLLYVKKKLAKS